MQVITPGHKYVLPNFENPKNGQTIQFIEKRISEIANKNGQPQLVTVNDGTTNEAVLEMLIDRLSTLYNTVPDMNTLFAVHHCDLALCQLHERTAQRQARNVEGTPAA